MRRTLLRAGKWRILFFVLAFVGVLTTISIMALTPREQPALHYLVRRPTVDTANPPLLLLLHGVGGNEQNLFSLANRFPENYLVVSVRGPLTFAPSSYAWFQVDFSLGQPVIVAEQAERARLMILQFIEELKKVENFDEHNVNLVGFSQGGIMSFSVALTAPEKVRSIAVMSGRLLPEIKPLVAEHNRLSKLKIYISHGTGDQVLRYQFAEDATEYLRSLGLQPVLKTYQDGHTINEEMLKDLLGWLGEN